MARLKAWCKDINAAQTKILFDYAFVEEAKFIEYAPGTFEALVQSFMTYKS